MVRSSAYFTRTTKTRPTIIFGKVFQMLSTPPRKPKNHTVRSREHLTSGEVESLLQAAKGEGRHGQRDATLILLMYRHGLRVSEAISLRWDQVDLKQGVMHGGIWLQPHYLYPI